MNYSINKGVNRPMEFRGLKAQYIGIMAIGLVALLLLFVMLYLCGVSIYVCIALTLGLGTGLIYQCYKLSNTYGAHGLLRKRLRAQGPSVLFFNSRQLFTDL